MLVYYPDHVRVSLPLARALLEFASSDITRPHLGVGITSRGALAATDGHALLIVENEGDCRVDGARPEEHHGCVWPTAHVEQALRVARARKESDVELRYADKHENAFPPCEQVVPDFGVELNQPIGFDPKYIGALALVVKALGVKAACLAAARCALDPLGFTVANPEGISARMVLMPMRLDASPTRLTMQDAASKPRRSRARKSA